MRMAVYQPVVTVPVRVRLPPVPIATMLVLMMLVVQVRVLVLHRLVHMRVLVPLGDVEPDARGHEGQRGPEPGAG